MNTKYGGTHKIIYTCTALDMNAVNMIFYANTKRKKIKQIQGCFFRTRVGRRCRTSGRGVSDLGFQTTRRRHRDSCRHGRSTPRSIDSRPIGHPRVRSIRAGLWVGVGASARPVGAHALAFRAHLLYRCRDDRSVLRGGLQIRSLGDHCRFRLRDRYRLGVLGDVHLPLRLFAVVSLPRSTERYFNKTLGRRRSFHIDTKGRKRCFSQSGEMRSVTLSRFQHVVDFYPDHPFTTSFSHHTRCFRL